MKLYRIILFAFSIVIFVKCTKEIPLDSNFEPQLFISGSISNHENYVTVEIQRTVPVDKEDLDPVNDANIMLYTKNSSGESILISDDFIVNNGTYISTEKIIAIIGNEYWIELILQDGSVYKSDLEILKEVVEVNEITTNDNTTRVIFSDPEDDTNFYLFHFVFYQNDDIIADFWELDNDILFNGNENAFYEIDEVIGNKVMVSIQNLNFKTFQFYVNAFTQLDSQTDDDGEDSGPLQLFSPPPAHLIGNIMDVSNNKRSLGFFGVYSYDYKTVDF